MCARCAGQVEKGAGQARVGWLAAHRGPERGQRAVDVAAAGLPVANGHPDGSPAPDGRSAEPGFAAVIHLAETLVGGLVGAEPEENLVEHDLVQHLAAG